MTTKRFLLCLLLSWVFMLLCLPLPKWNMPTSTVLFSKEGELLAARIASDEQWRFPEEQHIPSRFEHCLLTFEDKHFYHHLGVNPWALVRAMYLNLHSGKIKSGASTLTMQTIRMGRSHPPRSISEKIYEIVLAHKLELRYSKKKILKLYCSNAPFGNNVVGLSAASWRYYKKSPEQLSWAESATLAVLPNAPSLIYPGKRNHILIQKRNRLLLELNKRHIISDEEYRDALVEPLPSSPLPLPQDNETVLQYSIQAGYKGQCIRTKISTSLQHKVYQLGKDQLSQFGDQDLKAAVCILDAKSGAILAYHGNIGAGKRSYVDCIQAHRSSGSILKPILFAQALDQGLITPSAVLPDIPSAFGNYIPNNYNKTFQGLVPANEALSKSLNVPMIYLLRDVGVQSFKTRLKQSGFKTLHVQQRDYGLPLIVGGADVSLFEVCQVYEQWSSQLAGQKAHAIGLIPSPKKEKKIFTTAALYETLSALKGNKRPDEDGHWQAWENAKQIAWKTGTSFGNRDAWAIGVSTDYVIGVWIGHEQALPDQNLVGAKAAAPIMFALFNALPGSTSWFSRPEKEYTMVSLCKETGMPAGLFCNHLVQEKLPQTVKGMTACIYHRKQYSSVDDSAHVQNDSLANVNGRSMPVLELPPLIEKYLALSGNLPSSFTTGKDKKTNQKTRWQIQYPNASAVIRLPIGGQLPVELVGVQNRRLYWHLDDHYIQQTKDVEHVLLSVFAGEHTLHIMDDEGNRESCTFRID